VPWVGLVAASPAAGNIGCVKNRFLRRHSSGKTPRQRVC
jgi:hypothetical protein